MKIEVNDKEDKIVIRLPSGLFLNYFSANLIHGLLKKAGVKIKTSQIYKLIKTAKKCKKATGSWEIIQVESADGETVTIRI